MVNEGKTKIERFNGVNFRLWKTQIEDYMYKEDLYIPLGGKAQKPKEVWRLVGDPRSESPRGDSIIPGIDGCFQCLREKDDQRLDVGAIEDVQKTLSFK